MNQNPDRTVESTTSGPRLSAREKYILANTPNQLKAELAGNPLDVLTMNLLNQHITQ